VPTDLLIAFSAGAVSFFAPCVVPLLPAYVSYVGGAALPEIRANPAAFQRRVVNGSLLYILGFGVVFVARGVGAGLLGSGLRAQAGLLQRIGGVLVLLMGLALLGALPARLAQRTFSLAPEAAAGRLRATPFLLGVVFGTAWTPCVGPVLASILVLAANSHMALAGALLLAAYTLGLGLPFAVASLAVASFPGAMRPLARFSETVSRVSGVLLIVLGLLLLLGLYTALSGYLAAPFSG
jgi:cytochrome c-type biogenesis protein